jgi:Arc/MetJ-type ribon-helix-helix transcriptional regulator
MIGHRAGRRPAVRQICREPCVYRIYILGIPVAKVMISIPEELLEDLDREAGRRHVSRSELIRSALRRELGQPSPDEIDAAIERLRTSGAKMHSGDLTEFIRWDRDHGHSV